MFFEDMINVLAMIFSFAGIIIMIKVSIMIGGTIGKMIRYVVAGIFLSVFLHAVIELIGRFGFVSQNALLLIMGTLLTLGSVLFMIGGYVAFKGIR